ncbi:MAG TPA: hypothetical protein VLQ48_01865 [Chloroflexia bacterium]|nr:hypothetical protein [Chloroflexia bacterium]
MAKMIAITAGFGESTTGRPASYYDMTSGNTFFSYVENLVMHAVANPFAASNPPYCPSSTQPCFYPGENATRADIVANVMNAHLSNGYGQVFAAKSGTYTGVSVYITTPDNPVSGVQFIDAPVGMTTKTNGKFIESGPTKDCIPNCGSGYLYLHPYGSWGNWYSGGQDILRTVYLASGGRYGYKTIYFGGSGGQWQSQYCDATGCRGIVSSGDLGTTLPYVATGVEANARNVSVGPVTSSYAQYFLNGSWFYWCYDPTLPPWKTAYPPSGIKGSIGSCSTYDYSWTITNTP